jgi:hypothetical protein
MKLSTTLTIALFANASITGLVHSQDTSTCVDQEASSMWVTINTVLTVAAGVFPGAGAVVASAAVGVSRITQNFASCAPASLAFYALIAREEITNFHLDDLQQGLQSLEGTIKANSNPTSDNFEVYGAIANQLEGQAITIGFQALQLQLAMAALKILMYRGKVELIEDPEDKTHAISQLFQEARNSLDELHKQNMDLWDHLGDFTTRIVKDWSTAIGQVRDPQGEVIAQTERFSCGIFCLGSTAKVKEAVSILLNKEQYRIAGEVFDDNFYQAKHRIEIVARSLSGGSCDHPPSSWGSVSFGGSTQWLLSCFIDPKISLDGDFDNNGKTDVLVLYDDKWYIGYDGGGLNRNRLDDLVYLDHFDGVSFESVRVGDFNGDGKTDVFATWGDGKWHVSWSGQSSWEDLNVSGSLVSQLAFGDFNGDGKTDVFTTWGDGKWHVSWSGQSSWEDLNVSGSLVSQLAFGDFNGDGKTDVFTTWGDGKWHVSWSGQSSWEILNHSASLVPDLTFASHMTFASQSQETAVIADWKYEGF